MVNLLALLDDDAFIQRVNGQNSLRVGDLLAVDEDAALLDKPNNNLAVEYCKAILELGASLVPIPLPRQGAGHGQALTETGGQFASASALRTLWQNGGADAAAPYVPAEVLPLYREAFAAALPQCKPPVCYNGDITTTGQLHALEAEFPTLSGIMIGRGIIADPALFRKALGGPAATKAELRGYLDDLYHGYTELFGSAGCAISRMKGHWFYLIHCFADSEKLEKQLKKLREPWEYETVVNQIFTLPLI